MDPVVVVGLLAVALALLALAFTVVGRHYGGAQARPVVGADDADARRRASPFQPIVRADDDVDARRRLALVAGRQPDEPNNSRGFFMAVVGESYQNKDGQSRQKIIRDARSGDRALLVPEPDNPHDKEAVMVCLADGRQIGYVGRDSIDPPLYDAIGDGRVRAYIASVRGGTAEKPSLGVALYVAVERKPRRKARAAKTD